MNIVIDTLIEKTTFHDKVSKLFHSAMGDIKTMINSLVEVLNINYNLQKQDEKDRESIALMGLTQNTNTLDYQKNSDIPPITLDKNCLSCSGRTTVILRAFKAACLSYSPSTVAYKGHNLSRLNLLDCVNLAIVNLKTKLSDKDLLKSEIPDPKTEQSLRSIVRPKRTLSPDEEPDAIPWPKIEGSLPIQSPTSVSPKQLGNDRRASTFQPAIVEYKIRR